MKPNYPLVDDSVKHLEQEDHIMSKLFGIYGKHRYTVTVWQYSTQCFHRIGRHGAALKCLYETLSKLQAAIEAEGGENKLEEGEHEMEVLGDLEGIIHPEEQKLILKIDEVFGNSVAAIRNAREEILTQCHPFLSLSANIFIQHDPLKSLISSKLALMILKKNDNEIMQYVLEAILKQLNRPSVSILEQNDPENQNYFKTLKKLVTHFDKLESPHVRLVFLFAKSYVLLASTDSHQDAIS